MISLINITKTYRLKNHQVHALSEVTLNILNGEFVAVMGESGSGKSTLLNLLGLLDVPSSGRYTFDNEDVSAYSESQAAAFRRRKIGFVFQSFNLLPKLTVLNNVQMPLLLEGRDRCSASDKAAAVLKRVGLSNRSHHRPNELSGGQQQRVAIARALVNDPKLIIADEPTGNLDSETSRTILEIFSDLNQEGKTIVMVTHSNHTANYAKRIIQLQDGHVVSDGRPSTHNKEAFCNNRLQNATISLI